MYLGAHPDLLAFQLDHGFDPIQDPWDWGWEYEERVHSTDPFQAEFRFVADEEALTLRVDEDLTVQDVRRHTVSEGE